MMKQQTKRALNCNNHDTNNNKIKQLSNTYDKKNNSFLKNLEKENDHVVNNNDNNMINEVIFIHQTLITIITFDFNNIKIDLEKIMY